MLLLRLLLRPRLVRPSPVASIVATRAPVEAGEIALAEAVPVAVVIAIEVVVHAIVLAREIIRVLVNEEVVDAAVGARPPLAVDARRTVAAAAAAVAVAATVAIATADADLRGTTIAIAVAVAVEIARRIVEIDEHQRGAMHPPPRLLLQRHQRVANAAGMNQSRPRKHLQPFPLPPLPPLLPLPPWRLLPQPLLQPQRRPRSSVMISPWTKSRV